MFRGVTGNGETRSLLRSDHRNQWVHTYAKRETDVHFEETRFSRPERRKLLLHRFREIENGLSEEAGDFERHRKCTRVASWTRETIPHARNKPLSVHVGKQLMLHVTDVS